MGAIRASLRRLLVSTAIAVPVLAGAGPALAQDKPPTKFPEPSDKTPAQPAPVQAQNVIIVTGSRIPRRNLTAISPLTVVRGDEFKLEGATLTEDLINQLPQVTPDQGALLSNGASGTATVNLRDLGASRTLVLVNGRRLLPGDPQYAAGDINIIPSSIIQRVEVLTGGASSVYGSDAVSGVINFILDTKLDGLRVDGQVSFYQHGGKTRPDVLAALADFGVRPPSGNLVEGANRDINAAFGKSFFGGRGHVMLYAGYRSLTAIAQNARDYSACTITADPLDAVFPPNVRFCGGSPVSAEGTFRTFFDVFHLGVGRTFVQGRTLFNFAPYNYYQRPDRRYTAGGFANLDINDALKPYSEVMFMDDRTVAQIAPSGDFGSTFTINCDNPLLSGQQRANICFDGNFIGQTPIFDDDGILVGIDGSPVAFTDPVTGATYNRGFLLIARRNAEGGPRQDDRRHRDLRLLGGVHGDLGRGVTYDASFMTSSVKLIEGYDADVSLARLERAVDVIADPSTGRPVCRSVLTGEDPNCIPWDVFALGAVTPAAANYITLPASQRAIIRQKVANANATIELDRWGIRSPWAEEGPSLNVGAEYRRDTLDFEPDAAFQSGDLAGQGQPVIPFKGQTTIKELFGEVRLPLINRHLIESLTLEGGYRRSWHSDGGSKFSTNSYKIGIDFTPLRGVRLRASLQRAVRAPNIQELFAPQIPNFFDRDPCAGVSPRASAAQCAATGVAPAQYGHILANPLGDFGGYNSLEGGNPALGAETARTRAIGVVLEPHFIPGFNATVDWFDIDLKGAIEQIGAQTIMDTCLATADPIFCSRIHRDANGTLWQLGSGQNPGGFIDDTNANIGARKLRGIDLGAHYAHGLRRFGLANVEFLGSRLLKSVIDDGGLSTPFGCAGQYGFPCSYPLPKWRHTARLTWDLKSGPSFSLNWRHVGGTRVAALNPDLGLVDFVDPLETHIGAQDFFDFTATFALKPQYILRLGVRNLFDRQPPIVTNGNPGCFAVNGGCNGNTFTQLYDPLGRYIFAGVTLNLR